MFNTYSLIRDLKEYFKEATKCNYSEPIIDYDLNRLINRYVSDFEQNMRDDMCAELKSKFGCIEDAIDDL